MKFSHVPVNMYKKFFLILLFIFVGSFVVEFLASMLGFPINIAINEEEIKTDTISGCLLNAAITSFVVGGICNVFLTIRIIKEKLKLSHWPSFAVVIMTLFFLPEFLIGVVLIIPNIIIFGLKGKVKNRVYEVEF